MLWFILGIILVLIAVAFFVFGGKIKKTNYNHQPTGETYSLRPIGLLPLILGLVLIVISCISVVGTRNVGVETIFSRPTGKNYHSGLVWKLPWASVHDIDGAIQPEEYKGHACIAVKIGDGGTSCVDVAYRWRINPAHASEGYANYHNSDNILNEIRTAIVLTNMDAALNEVFGTWNPLNETTLSPKMTLQQLSRVKVNAIPPYEQFSAETKTSLEKKLESLGGLVEVESVTISYVKLPTGTQDRINAFNQAVQNTKIAIQDVATKSAEAAGNNKLAASLKDPNVLVSKCMDGLISGEIQNEPGFNCWGTGGSVVIPGTK